MVVIATGIWLSTSQPAPAMGYSLTINHGSTTIERVVPNYNHKSLMKTKVFETNVYNFYPQSLFLLSVQDPRVFSNESVLKLIKDLRGGQHIAISALLFMAFVFTILSTSQGFLTPPGWGLPNPAPAPIARPANGGNFPPIFDLFHGPRQCHSPSRSFQQQVMMANSDGQEQSPIRAQIHDFSLQDGSVDLNACYQEVLRRADSVGCYDFGSVCSFERFKALATEASEIDHVSAREAITVLNGEILNLYSNARRINYGPGVKGTDFAVEIRDRNGRYTSITHVEIKNPVGGTILLNENSPHNLRDSARNMGKRLRWQKKYWTNSTKYSTLENIDLNAEFPQSPANILSVVDLYDVPVSDHETFHEGFNSGTQNEQNVIFLNPNQGPISSPSQSSGP